MKLFVSLEIHDMRAVGDSEYPQEESRVNPKALPTMMSSKQWKPYIKDSTMKTPFKRSKRKGQRSKDNQQIKGGLTMFL